jgi:chemotaxis regulatin CheY-phosphate phosphatase CheZ
MSEMNPQEKVRTCLDYIDNRLETTSQQTIQIAEMIMEDIRELNHAYLDAVKQNTIMEHTEKVRETQLKWMSQLQDIIVEQTSRDLSGQVIQALQSFTDKLNTLHLKHLDFPLPSAVASKQSDAYEYLNQEDIDALINQPPQ